MADRLPGLDLGDERGAVLSPCGLYRYRLWRAWGTGPRCVFVCLNPSVADANQDDPTLRRLVGFARGWGHGRLDVVNLFGFRATKPRDCFKAPDPVGPDNDLHVAEAVRGAALVVVAWGANGHIRGRDREVLALLERESVVPHALRILASGQPEHPLYLPGSLRPQPYARPT